MSDETQEMEALHPHGSIVEQVHRILTTDQGVDAWVIAEEIVKFVGEKPTTPFLPVRMRDVRASVRMITAAIDAVEALGYQRLDASYIAEAAYEAMRATARSSPKPAVSALATTTRKD